MKQEEWNRERQLVDHNMSRVIDYLTIIEDSEVLLQAERTYIKQCKETIKYLIQYWPERSIVSQQRFVDEESQNV